jgi:hypothetical protein
MRWKAHTRTAEKVLEVFGAMHFNKYEKDLLNGVISPDNEDDRNHYLGREKTALDYLKRARDKRLKYDTAGSFFLLGVAFHYIQDMWTGVGPDYEDHSQYLELIDRCEILNIHESLEKYYPVRRKRVLDQFRALEKRLEKPVESEEELRELVMMRRPYESSAFLDLNFSFRICYKAAEMVLKTMFNVSLQESLESLHVDYVELVKNQEIQELRSIEALEERVEELSIDDSSISGINRWSVEMKLTKKKKEYESKKHLSPILHEYETKLGSFCKPHENWYNIDKPSLDAEKILTPQIEIMSVEAKRSDEKNHITLEVEKN